jgi:uncharacterized membrane protein YjjB (DUF3815 family)
LKERYGCALIRTPAVKIEGIGVNTAGAFEMGIIGNSLSIGRHKIIFAFSVPGIFTVFKNGDNG